jgi:hypothetical protein
MSNLTSVLTSPLSLVNAPIDESNRKEAIIYTIIYKQITFEDKEEDLVSYLLFCEILSFYSRQNNRMNNV